jgi:hypothetical protein
MKIKVWFTDGVVTIYENVEETEIAIVEAAKVDHVIPERIFEVGDIGEDLDHTIDYECTWSVKLNKRSD